MDRVRMFGELNTPQESLSIRYDENHNEYKYLFKKEGSTQM